MSLVQRCPYFRVSFKYRLLHYVEVATMRIERYTRYEREFQAAKHGLSVSAIAGP